MEQTCNNDEWKGTWDPFVRLFYQFGMLMGVDEFHQEQGFHLTKHRLSQRLFVGYGMVWGLDYSIDDSKGEVTVGPLLAIDELGRELWLKTACTIDLAQWLRDNGITDGVDTPVYVALDFQPCSVAPVPAIAQPCDDAAAPTMPSRLLESAKPILLLDPPADAIDVTSFTLADPANAATARARFEELVQLIRDDPSRPLLLGSFTGKVVTPVTVPPTTASTQKVHASPVGPAARQRGLFVVSVTPQFAGSPMVDVKFNRPPTLAASSSFRVDEIVPGGGLASFSSLATGATVDGSDSTLFHVALSGAPTLNNYFRVHVAGTGASPVLADNGAGTPIALGDGTDFATIIKRT